MRLLKKNGRLNYALFLPLCLFFAQAQYAHSQDSWSELETPLTLGGMWDISFFASPDGSGALTTRAWDEPGRWGVGETMRRGLIASGYCFISNTLLMYFNMLTSGANWTTPTPRRVRENLRGPSNWKWEIEDGFIVNQVGHPFQGSIYFNAGRANGFGFYESLFFTTFGSLTWEIFHEGLASSINDMLTTIPSGLSLGEVLFRLYVQGHAAGVPAPLLFIFNPAAGLHRLVTGWEPPEVERNFYDFRASFGGGFGSVDYRAAGPMVNGRRDVFSDRMPFADVGLRVIYGDPFTQNTWVPFRNFELHTSFGSNFSVGSDVFHTDIRIFTDGYLLSFAPFHTETSALSTGLSLFMDVAAVAGLGGQRGGDEQPGGLYQSGTINMYSNAIGWSAKYRHLFSPSVGLRTRAHAGFMFFGSSNYFHPTNRQNERNNFGYGLALRHLSSLELGRRSRIDANNFLYFMWSYPFIWADDRIIEPSQGFVWWQFHDFSFSHLVSPRVALGTTFSLATERGSFGDFPSTRKNHWSVRTFVAWNGQTIRDRL